MIKREYEGKKNYVVERLDFLYSFSDEIRNRKEVQVLIMQSLHQLYADHVCKQKGNSYPSGALS